MTPTTAQASILVLHFALQLHPGMQVFLSGELGDDPWIVTDENRLYINAADTSISMILLDAAQFLFEHIADLFDRDQPPDAPVFDVGARLA